MIKHYSLLGVIRLGKKKYFFKLQKNLKQKYLLYHTSLLFKLVLLLNINLIVCLFKRYQILRHVGVDANMMTTNPSESFIHVVPMNMVSYKGIKELHGKFKFKYSRIIGFKPTGWSLGKKAVTKMGQHVVHAIPYSEHSSVVELREMVQWLQPKKIVPTVNGGNPHAVSVCIFSCFFCVARVY